VRGVRQGDDRSGPFSRGRTWVMKFVPCLERSLEASELRAIMLGHPLVDDYLAFVGARAATNTVAGDGV
jgi:hypothetical protein